MVHLLLLFLATNHPAVDKHSAPVPPVVLEESLEPLKPKTPRNEENLAKVASAAFYAEGRVLYQRQDYAGALRRFQRAWRYHPDAVSILPEIVFLAHRLRRPDETARYALLAAQRTEIDYPLLLRLAGWLNERRDWAGAIQLYEKALRARERMARPAEDTPDVGAVLLNFELGRLHFLTNEFDKSAEFFARVRRAIEQPELLSQNESLQKMVVGQADRTYLLMAESFLEAGRYDEAAAMFNKVNEAKKNDGLLAFHLARVAARRGETQQALDQLDACFKAKVHEAGTEPYELLADLLRKTSRNDEQAGKQLEARLQQLLKDDAENEPLMYFLAKVYRDNRQWDEARKLLEKLVTLAPAVEVYQGLIQVYREQGRHDQLLETLGKAVALAGSLAALGETGEKLAEDAKLADRLAGLARQQIKAKGEAVGAEVPLAAAWLAIERKQYAAGQEFFGAALDSSKESSKAQRLLSWGLELMLAKQYEQAARVFQQAFAEKVVGDRGDAWNFYLIRALALAGKTDEAIKIAEQAVAAWPDSPRIQAEPGWVLYYAKRYAEAEQRYRAFVEKFDDQYDTSEIRDEVRDARLILSTLCIELGRRPEAEEWLEQVLDEFPEDIGALNDLGYLWTEQKKNLRRALVMIQQAVEGDPDNVAYIDSLGWAYYQLGRYEEAVQQLEKAVSSSDDPDGVILDHLGDAYMKANQKDKAIATWRRAVKAFESDEDAAKNKATLEKIKKHEK